MNNKAQHPKIKQELKVTHSLIEKCVALFRKQRTHWSAIDFYSNYLKDEVLKNVVDGMVKFPKSENV